MSAKDDYASKIKERLAELDLTLDGPQSLVPERGNGGIGGRERNKVRVMGAKLDEDVAGAKVLDGEPVSEEHERLFRAGVKAMRAGEYRTAITMFTRAIAAYPGGLTTRKGGQYAVWLAQALHAGGKRGDAKKLLTSIEKHPDGDVRTLADNVLYP